MPAHCFSDEVGAQHVVHADRTVFDLPHGNVLLSEFFQLHLGKIGVEMAQIVLSVLLGQTVSQHPPPHNANNQSNEHSEHDDSNPNHNGQEQVYSTSRLPNTHLNIDWLVGSEPVPYNQETVHSQRSLAEIHIGESNHPAFVDPLRDSAAHLLRVPSPIVILKVDPQFQCPINVIQIGDIEVEIVVILLRSPVEVVDRGVREGEVGVLRKNLLHACIDARLIQTQGIVCADRGVEAATLGQGQSEKREKNKGRIHDYYLSQSQLLSKWMGQTMKIGYNIMEKQNREQSLKPLSKIAYEKYTIIGRIGKGSFGEVYACVYSDQSKRFLRAIKIEDEKTRTPQLLNEAKLLRYVNPNNNSLGLPKVFESGNQNGFNYMVMEMLGPTLGDLFEICGKVFSLKTTLMIGLQLITRLEELHNNHYLYRDVKPQNFLAGVYKNSGILYLIDLGLSKRYRDPRTLIHIPYKEDKNIIGTIRYSSVNSHLGIEESRRDDLEALIYMLIYFIKGRLPWQGIKTGVKRQKQYKIMEKKLMITVESLTKDLPIEFCNILNYVKTLRFQEKPDYNYLKSELRNAFNDNQLVDDGQYDWCLLKQNKEFSSGASSIKIKIEKKDDGMEEENQNLLDD